LGIRLADWTGKDLDITKLKILSREAEVLTGPGALQDLDRFKRATEPLLA
jgi:hypothetical protein